MTVRARLLVVPSLFCALTSALSAQAPPDKQTTDKQTKETAIKTRPAKGKDPDPAAAERRNVAVSLLTSLADDARAFRDQKLRARVLARTADALWATEPERSRDLFRRAWDAAETGDAEAARQAADDLRRQQQGGAVVRRSPRDMRSEVLRIMAKRDRKLADEFLKKLEDAAEREAKEATADANRRGTDQWAAPAAVAKRLALARSLLQDGDVELALQFAGLVIFDEVNKDTIGFLSALRPKNAQAADTAFAALLARAAQDPAADANTVAGLSSYAFTPLLYITFGADGGSYANQEGPLTGPPNLSPELRAAFFRTGAAILMRPLLPPDQDQTTSGRIGKYLVIKRLLPLFEQFSPDQAALLRTEMTALASNVDPTLADGNRAIDRGIVPDNPALDPLQTMQDRLDHAKSSTERDGIYIDIAAALGGKGDPQARVLAEKVDDSEMRKSTLAYVDFELLNSAFQKKDAAELVRIAKSGELTPIQRSWGYSQAARIIGATDRARAVDYLLEAATEARRIGASDPDRARGLVAVASGFARTDRARAWEALSEAVKAANGADGFTGDDGRLAARLATKNMIVSTNSSSDDFDVAGVFTALAADDLYRSIELAKTFAAETARANATIAIARFVLETRAKTVNREQ
jgi:hypothetical protein